MMSETFEIKHERKFTANCESKGSEVRVVMYRWTLDGERPFDKSHVTIKDHHYVCRYGENSFTEPDCPFTKCSDG